MCSWLDVVGFFLYIVLFYTEFFFFFIFIDSFLIKSISLNVKVCVVVYVTILISRTSHSQWGAIPPKTTRGDHRSPCWTLFIVCSISLHNCFVFSVTSPYLSCVFSVCDETLFVVCVFKVCGQACILYLHQTTWTP